MRYEKNYKDKLKLIPSFRHYMRSGSVTGKYFGLPPPKKEKKRLLSLSPTPIQLLTPTQTSTPIRCLTLIPTPVLILTVGPTPVPCVTLASTPFMSASCSNPNSAPDLCLRLHVSV